jgi:serine/threonine protein phosphatase PrpC
MRTKMDYRTADSLVNEDSKTPRDFPLGDEVSDYEHAYQCVQKLDRKIAQLNLSIRENAGYLLRDANAEMAPLFTKYPCDLKGSLQKIKADLDQEVMQIEDASKNESTHDETFEKIKDLFARIGIKNPVCQTAKRKLVELLIEYRFKQKALKQALAGVLVHLQKAKSEQMLCLLGREIKVWSKDEASIRLAKQQELCDQHLASESLLLYFDPNSLLKLNHVHEEVAKKYPSFESQLFEERIGVASCIGSKEAMEDRWLINTHFAFGQFFVVFDGHGYSSRNAISPGAKAADLAKERFSDALSKSILLYNPQNTVEGMLTALEKTCLFLDSFFNNNLLAGTTLTAILVTNDRKIWGINVGDGRMMRVKNGDVQLMGYPASVNNPKVVKSFQKRNGEGLKLVPIKPGSLTTCKRASVQLPNCTLNLNLVRTLGNSVKNPDGIKIFTALPKVTMQETSQEEGEYLILSTDGLMLRSRSVAKAVHYLHNSKATPQEIAANLVHLEMIRPQPQKEAHLADNIVVIVIPL